MVFSVSGSARATKAESTRLDVSTIVVLAKWRILCRNFPPGVFSACSSYIVRVPKSRGASPWADTTGRAKGDARALLSSTDCTAGSPARWAPGSASLFPSSPSRSPSAVHRVSGWMGVCSPSSSAGAPEAELAGMHVNISILAALAIESTHLLGYLQTARCPLSDGLLPQCRDIKLLEIFFHLTEPHRQ